MKHFKEKFQSTHDNNKILIKKLRESKDYFFCIHELENYNTQLTKRREEYKNMNKDLIRLIATGGQRNYEGNELVDDELGMDIEIPTMTFYYMLASIVIHVEDPDMSILQNQKEFLNRKKKEIFNMNGFQLTYEQLLNDSIRKIGTGTLSAGGGCQPISFTSVCNLFEKLMIEIHPKLTTTLEILWVGCGYGEEITVIALMFKKLNIDVKIYAIDIEDKAIEIAELNFKNHKVKDKVIIRNISLFQLNNQLNFFTNKNINCVYTTAAGTILFSLKILEIAMSIKSQYLICDKPQTAKHLNMYFKEMTNFQLKKLCRGRIEGNSRIEKDKEERDIFYCNITLLNTIEDSIKIVNQVFEEITDREISLVFGSMNLCSGKWNPNAIFARKISSAFTIFNGGTCPYPDQSVELQKIKRNDTSVNRLKINYNQLERLNYYGPKTEYFNKDDLIAANYLTKSEKNRNYAEFLSMIQTNYVNFINQTPTIYYSDLYNNHLIRKQIITPFLKTTETTIKCLKYKYNTNNFTQHYLNTIMYSLNNITSFTEQMSNIDVDNDTDIDNNQSNDNIFTIFAKLFHTINSDDNDNDDDNDNNDENDLIYKGKKNYIQYI